MDETYPSDYATDATTSLTLADRIRDDLLKGYFAKLQRTQISMSAQLAKRGQAAVEKVNAELPPEAHTDMENLLANLLTKFCDDMGV